MKTMILIDGKEVTFKSDGFTTFRYKKRFNRSLLLDTARLFPYSKIENFNLSDVSKEDIEIMFNIAWVFAKTADQRIPDKEKWLEQFRVFPLAEIFPQLTSLIIYAVQSKNPILKV